MNDNTKKVFTPNATSRLVVEETVKLIKKKHYYFRSRLWRWKYRN